MVSTCIMQRHFGQIEALNEISKVLEYARDVFLEQGAVCISYHVSPLFDEPATVSTAVYSHGFSDDWLELYEREDFRIVDPIPQRVMQHGAMMTWKEAQEAAPNSPNEERYFVAMREYGLIHGAGVPLFGPRGRDAYVGFDLGKPIIEAPAETLGILRSVAQAGHQRVCVLLDQAIPLPVLSDREVEVLTWTARGKSMSSIATILDLSPDTVKTYSKRIYAKLDVSDRVGAVVKALRLGLVKV